MKKFNLLAMSAVLAASMAVPAAAAENWEKAYSDIIYQRSLEDDFKRKTDIFAYRYAIYDIDGNGTPELFCGERDNLYIYTMKNGKIKKIGSVGQLGMSVVANDNAMIDGSFSFGIGEDYIAQKYVMSNGEFNSNPDTISIKYKPGATGAGSAEELEKYATYYVNGRVVSKSAYEAKTKTFYGDNKELDFYEMTKSGFRVNDLQTKITKRIVNKQATASSQKITVNGRNVTAESYLIDGNNYCKLRDIAYILKGTDSCFNVGWDSVEQMILLYTGRDYTGSGGKSAIGKKTATSTAADIYIDSDYVQLEGYNIGGSNYFKLRDIAEFVDAEVAWNNATKSVNIRTQNAPQSTSKEDILQAYDKFLKDSSVRTYHFSEGSFVNTVETSPERFAIKDLDGDGKPELLIGQKAFYEEMHPNRVGNFVAYKYQNGKMVAVDGIQMESYTPYVYLLDGSKIVTFQSGSGGLFLWHYYDFKNSVIKSGDYDREFKKYIGYSDYIELSEKHLDTSNKLSEIKFVDNTSSNRAAYLK